MRSKNWTRENLAYLAGLLEGEGSFSLTKGRYLKINLKMTDEDVIRKAQEIAGVGTLTGPYKVGPEHHKEFWVWHVYDQYKSYALAVALLPWFGERRKNKITECVQIWLNWRQTNPVWGNPNFGRDMFELKQHNIN